MAAVSFKDAAATDSSPAQSPSRTRPPRKRRRKSLLLTVLFGAVLVYFAPFLIAVTSLREIPLRMVFEGIDGTIHSGSASLGWFSPVKYRDVEVYDRDDKLVVRVPAVTIERTSLQLLFDRSRLGKVTLEQPSVNVVARDRGSNAEDVLLPWWNLTSSGPIEMELSVIDGTIHLQDEHTRNEWTISSLAASLALSLDEPATPSYSAKGNINDSQNDGIFTITSAAYSASAVELKAEQVPLAMFEWLARRGFDDLHLTGDLACDLTIQPAGQRQSLRGQLGITQLRVSGKPLQGDTLAIDDLTIAGDLAFDGARALVKELTVDCEVGRITARGDVATYVPSDTSAIAALLREQFTVNGSLDLARASRMLPKTLRVRSDTQINDATVQFHLASTTADAEHRWQARLETGGLSATSAGRPVRWENPITIDLAAHGTKAGIAVDSLACSANFLQMTGKGTADNLTADLQFDLDRLKADVGQLIDLGSMRLAGGGRAQLHWQRDDGRAFRATAAAQLKNFELGASASSAWREADLAAELNAAGHMTGTAVDRLQSAVMRITAAAAGSAPDTLELHLREPVEAGKAANVAIERLPLLIRLTGSLAQWRTRLAPWVDLQGWQLAGTVEAHANATWTPTLCELHSLEGGIQNLQATNGRWFIDEPLAKFTATGRYALDQRRIELGKSALETSAASLNADQAAITFSDTGSISATGKLAIVGDLARLQRWTNNPKQPAAIAWSGQFLGRADLTADAKQAAASLDCTIENLVAVSTQNATGSARENPLRASAAGAPAGRAPLWQEKQLALAAKATYSKSDDTVQLENLRVAAEALALNAAGDIQALGGKANMNLQGQADCDWSRLSKLLTPYLGESVRIEGRDKRDFTVRGPIAALLDGSSTSTADPFVWTKPLSAKASVGWQRAEAYGMQIGQGAIAGNLQGGLVKFDPIELAVSKGRVRLSPQIVLTPAPAEFVHGQAKVIDRVQVTPQMAATWLKFIAPAVAEATETQGELSLDLTGAKVPLFTPETASAVGRLEVHSLQVTPGPPARAVILLAEQIRALIERRPPPTELNRNPTLLAINDQKIDFRMAGGRVVHQGMTMNVGEVTIRTSGWVGFDETMGLVAEIPIKAEWVQQTPALASMQGQSLQIPIGGTLRRPQIDPRAWQQVLALFAQGAARGLIEDQLNRLLER
jgi:hypothetical protein